MLDPDDKSPRVVVGDVGALIDAIPAHLAVLRPDGVIESVNRSWVRFATGNGMRDDRWGVGLNYLEICDGASGSCRMDAVRLANAIREIAGGVRTEYHAEYECSSPDETRWFQVRVTRFETEDGPRILVCHENVTEHALAGQRATRDLERAAHDQRRRITDEMASVLAHELNQPLTAIMNYANGAGRLLAQAGGSAGGSAGVSGDVSEALSRISGEADRAARVIRGIRAFTRPGRGEREVHAISSLLREAASLSGMAEWTRDVRIEVETEPWDADVLVDATQIHQVLLNLLRNSCEAIGDSRPDRREVTLSYHRAEGDQVVVRVDDTARLGAEIDVHAVFDAFVTSRENGIGLGLAISRSIVRSHGGRTWADVMPGGGLRVSVCLPTVRIREMRYAA